MKNYNDELDLLLKKYNLFEELDEDSIGEKTYKFILEKIDLNKKYIVICDQRTNNVFAYLTKNIKRKIIFKSFGENLEQIKHKLNKYESELKENDIIIFLRYNKEIKSYLKGLNIIDLGENFPECLKLKNSLKESFFLRKIEILETYLKKIEFERYITNIKNELIKNRGNNLNTIIFGAGEHTEYLLHNTNIIEILNVKLIVDSNEKLAGKFINGVQIIDKKKLKHIDFNTFLISSKAYENEIKVELKEKYPKKNIITIYDLFMDVGSLFKIKLNKNIEAEHSIMRNLIRSYLCIRDFYSYNIYIKKFIEQKYDGYEQLNLLKNDLEKFMKEIKNDIKSIETSNIQFMIFDAVDKDGTDKYMKNVIDFAKSNIEFENAFSPSTYTTESHLCMFNEKYLFEDNNFIRKRVHKDTNNFAKLLKEIGYKMYSSNSATIIEDIFDYKISKSNVSIPMSRMLWNNLCTILITPDMKKFIYSRFMEHHDSWEKEHYIYMDNQFKYYSEFFGENDLIVVSADHGYLNEISENRMHIPLIIKTPRNDKINIKELFSTKDILKIIRDIINNKFNGVDKVEYIKIERTPFYNRELIDMCNVIPEQNKYLHGFQIIRSLKGKYVIFGNGIEEYYLICEENGKEINSIDNSNYKKEIKKFRELHKKNYFPNFSLDDNYYMEEDVE